MSKLSKFSLILGVVAEPICKQLEQQDIVYDFQFITEIQNDHDSIKILSDRKLLSKSLSSICYEKIFNKITTHIADRNGMRVIAMKRKEAKNVSIN